MTPPTCDFCKLELTEPGGLLFSPPNGRDQVWKYHVCVTCYAKLFVTNDLD